ncbi:MAG: serine hydrolase domain-containing protein [Myxococcota bacterium]
MKRSLIERKLGKVETALDKAIEKQETAGAVVLARMPREGEVLEYAWVRGLAAARPERLPMRRDTIFDLASLTKPIATTSAIMMLVEEGGIALDDPVAKVLPTFAERGKEAVTIRHLLTHSAGLKPVREFHELLIQKERKTGERLIGTPEGKAWIVDRVLRSAPVHEPGAAAVYGDLNFITLSALVEEVSKQPFDEFCESRIFTRLGLVETRFFPIPVDGSQAAPDTVRRRVAATENCAWRERIVWGEAHDPNCSAMGGVAGHAGLFSTADDVMRFGQLFLDAYHGRNESLPPDRVREFCEKQFLPESSDWAIGWDTPTRGVSTSGELFSDKSVGHTGFTGTSLWIDLERELIVVMLTNRIHQVVKRSKFALRPKVHDAIVDAFTAS